MGSLRGCLGGWRFREAWSLSCGFLSDLWSISVRGFGWGGSRGKLASIRSMEHVGGSFLSCLLFCVSEAYEVEDLGLGPGERCLLSENI